MIIYRIFVKRHVVHTQFFNIDYVLWLRRTVGRQFTATSSNSVYSSAGVSMFSRIAVENVTATYDVLVASYCQ